MGQFAPIPPAVLSRVLSKFDRHQLAGFVEVAIDLMDLADDDPDIEPNGDEEDGTRAEDDFCLHRSEGAAGCPVSDPDAAVDDSPCDACMEDGL